MSPILPVIMADFLWFLVFVGWVILIVVGLEADKPLSGGIPGHIDMHEQRQPHDGRCATGSARSAAGPYLPPSAHCCP